ncbi:lipopolysaccharide biosynthesis protein [Ornithinimicrobium sediminis]|uniref:lipopolysaccharide biosynthesis protein n=1 Tax=Ornithinimicrobium sediminis TaxID=2904603 RepID=UPI001E411209|nr:hypothetical protein [Ornithinimicrobium sediminis]MCE0485989.1 hypothetical protein [Ornithinimicrobium sediminis]
MVSRLRSPHFRDLALTTSAFGAIVGVQQVLLLPFLAAMTNTDDFSKIILFVTISAIVANVTGGEAANTALVRGHQYAREGAAWDFHLLLVPVLAVLAAAWVVVAPVLNVSSDEIVLFAVISVLTALRLFLAAPFRYEQRFGTVLVAHLCYAAGSASALLLVARFDWVLAPFLVGEACAVLVLSVALLAGGRRLHFGVEDRRRLYRTSTKYLSLASVGLLANAVGYLDRLIIYPLLGAGALAVYYAASVLPKSLALVVNPVTGLLLAKFGAMGDERGGEILERLYRVLPWVIIVLTLASLAIGLLGLQVLYPQFAEEGRPIVLPVSISVGLASAAYLMQPYVLRFRPSGIALMANILYAGVFVGAAVGLSLRVGLHGFAWATVAAHLVLLGFYLVFARPRTERASS